MSAVTEATPLRDGAPPRGPRRAFFLALALAFVALGAVTTRRGGAALGVDDAVGVSGGERVASKEVVIASACVLTCGANGDAANAVVADLSLRGDGPGPTCAQLRAATTSSCFRSCSCMEKVDFQTGVDVICASGETTVDYVESAEFTKKLRAAERDNCPKDFAATATQLPENNASALGVRVRTLDATLGYKDVWVPKYSTLQPRAPTADERAGTRAPTTFKVFTQCKTDQVKQSGNDFWFKPLTAAYIVRHNYGSQTFFGEKSRLRMQRAELEDGVYGYTLTTDQVDWEYGFELENADSESFVEIGRVSESVPTILQRESCARRFGEYFNRVMTDETNPSTVSYVFGDCNTQCPKDYRDAAYCTQPISGTIANQANAALNLGKTADARLINIASAMLWNPSDSVLNYRGVRTYVTKYNDGSRNEQDWIVGASDRERNAVKMAMIRVSRDETTGEAKVWRLGTRKYILRMNDGYAYSEWPDPAHQIKGCRQNYCNVARYPLPSLWDKSATNSGADYNVMRLQYTKLDLGDAPPKQYTVSFDAGMLSASTPAQLLAPGSWGQDIDVRRIVLRTGTICGSWINWQNCMFANAIPVNPDHWGDYSGPTKTKKQWLIVLMDGYFKATRIEVTVGKDGGVYSRAIDARYVERGTTEDPSSFDPLAYDLSQLMAVTPRRAPVAQGPYSSGGYGVGALTFQLAAEMSASLRGVAC